MAAGNKSVRKKYTTTQFCHCCLSADRVLRPIIENQKYQNILMRLISLRIYRKSISISKYLLCWECIAVLHKVSLFQSKVLKAQVLLKMNELNYSSLSNLSITTLQSMSYDYTAEIYVDGTKLEIDKEVLLDNTEELLDGSEELLDNIEDLLDSKGDLLDNKEDILDNKEDILDDNEEHGAEALVDNAEYDTEATEIEESNLNLGRRKILKSEENYDVVLSRIDVKCSKLSTTIENNKTITDEIRNSDWFKNAKHNCKKCVEIFHNSTLKKQHCVNFHYKNSAYECDACDSRFRTKAQLDEHFKSHFCIYKCAVCPTVTSTESQNKEHYRLNHLKTYCCKKCPMAFGRMKEFKKHHKKLHEKWACDQCGKIFKNQERLPRHILWCHTPQRCEPCGKDYVSFKALKVHRYLWHPTTDGDGDSYCVECDKRFATSRLYRQHLKGDRRHQPRKKTFPCPVCEKIYCKKINMTNHHRYVHLGKTNYYCVDCDKRFLSQTKLTEHVKRVHEHRPRPKNKLCSICGRGFQEKNILVNHMRTHTGERPFQCPECPASFAQKVALTGHMRRHTGERPYPCPQCPARFAQKGAMTGHLKSVHSKGKGQD